jgi:hypothetical protein
MCFQSSKNIFQYLITFSQQKYSHYGLMVENSRIKRYSTISPKTFKSCYCSVFVAFSLFLFTFFTVFRVSKLPVSCSTHYVDISFHQFSIHCAASALFISSLLSMAQCSGFFSVLQQLFKNNCCRLHSGPESSWQKT